LHGLKDIDIAGNKLHLGLVSKSREVHGGNNEVWLPGDRTARRLSASAKAQLVANLASATQMSLAQLGTSIGTAPSASGTGSSGPLIAPGITKGADESWERPFGKASQCIKLMNLFDPEQVQALSNDAYDDWKDSIEDDVGEECDKKGKIVHIRAKSTDPTGAVFVCMRGLSDAILVATAIAGRYYDKREIKVEYMSTQDYVEKFPKVQARLDKIAAKASG